MLPSSQNRIGIACGIVLLLSGAGAAALAQQGTDDPVSVWEIWYNLQDKPFRISFLRDGTADDGTKWVLDRPRIEFKEDHSCVISADGWRLHGRGARGAFVSGRMLYEGILLVSEPAPAPAPLGKGAAGTSTKGKVDNRFVGPYELQGSSRMGRRFRLSTHFTADGDVMDDNRKIATWERDKRLVLKFLDTRVGEIGLNSKKRDTYEGKTKGPDKDNWTWTVFRILPIAECKVDGGTTFSGTLTLYNNGRLNSPTSSEDCRGCWSQTGRTLEFNNLFECQLVADGRSFSSGNLSVKGTVTSGSLSK